AGGESFTYDGDPHPATVSVTGAGGLNLTPSPVYSCGHAPINVVDSGCTASYSYAGTNNYNPSSDSKTYTIAKADPVLSSVGGTFTYDGLPHGGSATATGGKGESLTPVNVAYKDSLGNLLTSAPVDAGNYLVSARFAGNDNYNQKQSAAEPLIINKADTTTAVTVAGGISFTYDGVPHPATVSVTGPGGLNLTPAPVYSCGHAPINVADSGCIASYNYAGTNNYNPSSDSKTYTIIKADPVLSSVGGTFTYDGLPHGGSATATGVKGENLTPVNVAYKDSLNNLLISAPVDAGNYLVSARFAGNDNYNQKQSAAEPLIINKADTTTVVTVAGGTSFTYDGDPHPATVLVTGAGGLNLTPSPVYSCGHAPINIVDSGCTASYNYAGTNNYNASSDSTTYTIIKADPVLSSVGGTFTYDGLPHGGSATATGVKGENLTPVNVAYKDSLNNLLIS